MDQLRSHLEKSGGRAEGVLWEYWFSAGPDKGINEEGDEPEMGLYSLNHNMNPPTVEFQYMDSETPEIPPIVVTEDDVLIGAVQVIARRIK